MANVTVTSTNPAITVTKSNSVVNVASTSSTITVSAIASLANANVVRSQVSAVDAGGDGSFSYNNTSGVFTYTGPSAAEVRAHLSNTSPIQYNSSTGAIGIDSSALFTGKTTDDLSEGSTNLYFTTARANTAIVDYIGSSENAPYVFAGNISVAGNLNVAGNLDYENVTDLYVTDQKITLNANATTDATVQIIANRPQTQNTALRWNEPTDTWQFSNDGSTYIDFLGPTSTRALFSAGGDLSYNSSTGEFSYTRGPGDIEGVTAGDGLSGGGTSGTVSLAVDSTVVRTTGVQTIAGNKTFSNVVTFNSTTDFNDTMTVQDMTGNGGTLANTKIVFPADQSNAIIRYQGTTGALTIDSSNNIKIQSDRDNSGSGNISLVAGSGAGESEFLLYDRLGSATAHRGNLTLKASDYIFTGGLGTGGGGIFHTGHSSTSPIINSSGHFVGDLTAGESDSVGLLGKLSYAQNFLQLSDTITAGREGAKLSARGNLVLVYNNTSDSQITNFVIRDDTINGPGANVITIDRATSTTHNVTSTANIIAPYFIGDGSALTNLPGSGTVTSVTAGAGMTQSGSANVNPTLDVVGGFGITVNADSIELANADLANSSVSTSKTIIKTVIAAETLAKGDAVYISGGTGDNPEVSKADADDASKMPVFGVTTEAVTATNTTDLIIYGLVDSYDTTSFITGDSLFVSTTAGALANTAPTGESALLQTVGKVIKGGSSGGKITVTGAGRTNATPNLNDGKIFIGNGSNQSTTATLDTSIVPENTNLYYTTARANAAIADYTGDMLEVGNVDVQEKLVVNDAQTNTTGAFQIKQPTLSNFTTVEDFIQLGNESSGGFFSGGNITALTNNSGGLFKIGGYDNAGHLSAGFWGGKSAIINENLYVGRGLNFSRTALNINTRYNEGYTHFVGTGASASANVYINMSVGQTTGTPAGNVANATVGIKTHDGQGYILGWHDPIDSSVINYDNEPSYVPTSQENGWYAFKDLAKTTVAETFDSDLTVSGKLSMKQFNETVVALGSQNGNLAALASLNAANGSIFTVTATGDITLSQIPNATAGSSFTFFVTQDGTGSRLLTSTFKYQGGDKTLTTAAGNTDVISVVYDGSNYFATLSKDYY